jgi:hypothetical protein
MLELIYVIFTPAVEIVLLILIVLVVIAVSVGKKR